MPDAETRTINQDIQFKRITSRVIPGILTSQNKGALDWAWHSLLAYGCHNVVVIVDTVNACVIQTLDKHQSPVVKVKWAKCTLCHDLSNPPFLKLASADESGNIIAWNVSSGEQVCCVSDGNKQITDLEWLNSDLLAAIHSPSTVIVWNLQDGTKKWKKSYTEVLLQFAWDPFSPSNVVFMSSGCLLLVSDFSTNNCPEGNGRKFYLTNTTATATTPNLSPSDQKKDSLRRRVKLLVGVDSKVTKNDETSLGNSCLALAYHPAYRHHILLLYPREVLVLDLEIYQTVGIVSIERNSSPLVQMIPCKQKDAIYCLHENGIVSFHVRRRMLQEISDETLLDGQLEVIYDSVCQSDPLRLARNCRWPSMAICQRSQRKIAILISDGRILFLEAHKLGNKTIDDLSCCKLEHMIPPLYSNPDSSSQVQTKKDSNMKLLLVSLAPCSTSPVTVIKMCPPLTTKNWNVYQPWLAAGTTIGTLLIFDLSSGLFEKEFCIHSQPISGIEWVSLSGVLSFAHQSLGGSNGVKNELHLTDVNTGKMQVLRGDAVDSSSIDLLRVSHLKQYFIIAFKDDPFELWDLTNLTLLRNMPRKFPTISTLEWSPVNNMKSLKKKYAEQLSTNSLDSSKQSDATSKEILIPEFGTMTKEHFVTTDTEGQLFHFSVEGSLIKDGHKVPTEESMGSVTSNSWKGDQLVMGDVDGNLILWDLKARLSKSLPTNRGWIKKLKCAPGRGNMKVLVLYNDGVDVWDVREIEVMGQIKCPRDMPKVLDIDWAASDKPVLLTSDNCIRIMNLELNTSNSPLSYQEITEAIFCPQILPHSVSLNLRSILQHQAWRDQYTLTVSSEDGFTPETLPRVKNLINVLGLDIQSQLLSKELGIAEKCLLVSSLYGDESDIEFWTVACYYLNGEATTRHTDRKTWQYGVEHLDTCFDLLCDQSTFKRMQMDRLALLESKRSSWEQTQRCVERLICLRQTQRAVKLLLETESKNDAYQLDCLRACLVECADSSGINQSTIKIVATSLIANDDISLGVQLLCIIGMGMDACRYLQLNGNWEYAAWLAKCMLNRQEITDVMRRWAENLTNLSVPNQAKACLLTLSTCAFSKTLELLLQFNYVERAVMFVHACQELGLLEDIESSHELIKHAYLKYGDYLLSLGNKTASNHYFSLVKSNQEELNSSNSR